MFRFVRIVRGGGREGRKKRKKKRKAKKWHMGSHNYEGARVIDFYDERLETERNKSSRHIFPIFSYEYGLKLFVFFSSILFCCCCCCRGLTLEIPTSGVFFVVERGFARVLAPTLDVLTSASPWEAARWDCNASPLLYPLDISSEDLMLLKFRR